MKKALYTQEKHKVGRILKKKHVYTWKLSRIDVNNTSEPYGAWIRLRFNALEALKLFCVIV